MDILLDPVILDVLLASLFFMPVAVLIASLIRGILILSGKRRVFTGWVRNKLYVALLYLTLPGLVLIFIFRRIFLALFRVKVVKSHWVFTYGEPTPTFEVETPRSVIQAFLVLFSVFYFGTIIMLEFFNFGLILSFPLKIVLVYLAFSIWFNLSITSGDVLIFTEILKNYPRTAIVEFIVLVAVISLSIMYLGGMLA